VLTLTGLTSSAVPLALPAKKTKAGLNKKTKANFLNMAVHPVAITEKSSIRANCMLKSDRI
jgi:hypothetical protein